MLKLSKMLVYGAAPVEPIPLIKAESLPQLLGFKSSPDPLLHVIPTFSPAPPLSIYHHYQKSRNVKKKKVYACYYYYSLTVYLCICHIYNIQYQLDSILGGWKGKLFAQSMTIEVFPDLIQTRVFNFLALYAFNNLSRCYNWFHCALFMCVTNSLWPFLFLSWTQNCLWEFPFHTGKY